MTDICLNLLAAPELIEPLLDRLLMHPNVPAFVSQQAASHGGHGDMAQREQVLGRADAVQIQVLLAVDDLDAVLTELRLHYTNSGVMFWVVPVLSRGVL